MKENYVVQEIAVNGKIYKYKISFNYKRTISMRVNKSNEVIVRGSKIVSQKTLKDFISNNIEHMYEFLKTKEKNYITDIDTFVTLEEKKYPLIYKISSKNEYQMIDDEFHITIKNNDEKVRMVKEIYNDFTSTKLKELRSVIENYFIKLELKHHDINHKWLRGKWGYCDIKKRKIYISDLLSAFLPEALKYVVFHEIAHLIHPDHSSKFWKTVSIAFPNYAFYRKYMKNKDVLIK
ncbi:MAG: SprT family zinc-dependent metalloprotease [Mycoplasmoidaceae bacterium]|nr:MAG: SprT family zinc-dependent metalloprotease [Mycoplasmoidaceae bacterium]